MLTSREPEVLHPFDNSICPDTNVAVFVGFTVFSLLWMIYQSILSSRSCSASPARSTLAIIILTITYTNYPHNPTIRWMLGRCHLRMGSAKDCYGSYHRRRVGSGGLDVNLFDFMCSWYFCWRASFFGLLQSSGP